MGLDHRQQNAFGFQVAIAESRGAAVFDAAHLHPHQVIGVVDDAHLVGFGVAHPQARFHMVCGRLVCHRWGFLGD